MHSYQHVNKHGTKIDFSNQFAQHTHQLWYIMGVNVVFKSLTDGDGTKIRLKQNKEMWVYVQGQVTATNTVCVFGDVEFTIRLSEDGSLIYENCDGEPIPEQDAFNYFCYSQN